MQGVAGALNPANVSQKTKLTPVLQQEKQAHLPQALRRASAFIQSKKQIATLVRRALVTATTVGVRPLGSASTAQAAVQFRLAHAPLLLKTAPGLGDQGTANVPTHCQMEKIARHVNPRLVTATTVGARPLGSASLDQAAVQLRLAHAPLLLKTAPGLGAQGTANVATHCRMEKIARHVNPRLVTATTVGAMQLGPACMVALVALFLRCTVPLMIGYGVQATAVFDATIHDVHECTFMYSTLIK